MNKFPLVLKFNIFYAFIICALIIPIYSVSGIFIANSALECHAFQNISILPTCDLYNSFDLISHSCLRSNVTNILYIHQVILSPVFSKAAIETSIKSFVITQALKNTRLILWTDVDSASFVIKTQVYKKFQKFILIRLLDFHELIMNTPLERSLSNSNEFLELQKHISISSFINLLRFVILYKHGGFFIDNNAILLRDFAPLFTIGYQFIPYSNTFSHDSSILFLWKKSPLAERILASIAKVYKINESASLNFYHDILPILIFKNNWDLELGPQVHAMNLYMYPNAWFDPMNNICKEEEEKARIGINKLCGYFSFYTGKDQILAFNLTARINKHKETLPRHLLYSGAEMSASVDIITRNLCLNIINQHFGSINCNIIALLLSYGRCSLQTIIQKTKTSPKMAKESLYSLLQHNLITFIESDQGSRSLVFYQAIPAHILYICRYPWYICTANELFETHGKSIAFHLLSNGRSCFSSLPNNTDPALKQAFIDMIHQEFILKCNPQDSISQTDILLNEEADAIEKSGKIMSTSDLNKLKKELAAKRNLLEISTQKKRKWTLDLDDDDASIQELKNNDLISDFNYYRINFERFHIHFRNMEFSTLAEKRINTSAGAVLAAMLKQHFIDFDPNGITMTKLCTSVDSQKVSLDVEGPSHNKLQEYVEALCRDQIKFVVKHDERGGGQYKINTQILSETMQFRILESIIQEKWGNIGCRIWRLLKEKNKLEEKQIAKLGMISAKLARECLYSMLEEGFVFMQDVPKSADHSASRTYFLWFISVEKTRQLIIKKSYKSINNMYLRTQKELNDRTLLLEKMQRTDVVSGKAKLSESDQKGISQLNFVLERLASAELRIDYMVMMLRDI